MNVLYVHQYFCTPEDPGGTRSYWISKELVNRGHHVTMITSSNKKHPYGRVIVDGIDVVYVKTPSYSNYMSPLRKVWAFVAFIINAYVAASKENDIDIVFATSTPLTVGVIALWLKKRKNWKYVFEVRDLWPEFPIQMGVIKNKFAINLLKRLEKRIYEKSEHVIALSPGMKEGVLKSGISDKKCTIIPNMSKPDKFYPHIRSIAVAKNFGIDFKNFNVIHFGSMGRANGLEYIIESSRYLKAKGCTDINFLFMGGGATEPMLKNLVKKYELENVFFLGSHKMSVVSEVVNCCDATITTFINLPILKTNSPNKLFDSLSAGKPIIVNSAGWTKELCEQENCGFYVDPEKPEDLADKLIEIKNNSGLLKTWGDNARRLSIEVFDKDILSSKVADILERSVK